MFSYKYDPEGEEGSNEESLPEVIQYQEPGEVKV